MSAFVAIGRWGGFAVQVNRGGVRLVLGFVVLAVVPTDLDHELGAMTTALQKRGRGRVAR